MNCGTRSKDLRGGKSSNHHFGHVEVEKAVKYLKWKIGIWIHTSEGKPGLNLKALD